MVGCMYRHLRGVQSNGLELSEKNMTNSQNTPTPISANPPQVTISISEVSPQIADPATREDQQERYQQRHEAPEQGPQNAHE